MISTEATELALPSTVTLNAEASAKSEESSSLNRRQTAVPFAEVSAPVKVGATASMVELLVTSWALRVEKFPEVSATDVPL